MTGTTYDFDVWVPFWISALSELRILEHSKKKSALPGESTVPLVVNFSGTAAKRPSFHFHEHSAPVFSSKVGADFVVHYSELLVQDRFYIRLKGHPTTTVHM